MPIRVLTDTADPVECLKVGLFICEKPIGLFNNAEKYVVAFNHLRPPSIVDLNFTSIETEIKMYAAVQL